MTKRLLCFAVVLCIACAASLRAFPPSQTPSTNSPTGQFSKETPTPVEAGKMTPKEKVLSKLLDGHGIGSDLNELTKEGHNVSIFQPPESVGSSNPKSPQGLVAAEACAADAVIVGFPMSRASQLTDSRQSVFSSYEFQALRVLKNNPKSAVAPGDTLTVARPGGFILLNGKTVKVLIGGGLLIPQHIYLVFLKYIPEAGSYRPWGQEAVYATAHMRLEALRGMPGTLNGVSVNQMTVWVQDVATTCGSEDLRSGGPKLKDDDAMTGARSALFARHFGI